MESSGAVVVIAVCIALLCVPAEKVNDRLESLDLPALTNTPYQKTPSECYGGIERTNDVAFVSLLPVEVNVHLHGLDKLLQTLPNLVNYTTADIILFHTSTWTVKDIAPLLPSNYTIHVVCIATEHWKAPRRLENWEHVEPERSGGYRSMCRWYSRIVSDMEIDVNP